MARTGRIQHWKHGWIPLTPEARAFVEGRGPNPTSGHPSLALSAPKPYRAADVPAFDSLSPKLQGKINAKLEALTGLPEPELAAKVQDNLVQAFRNGQQVHADWYAEEGADIADRASAIRADFPGSKVTQEQLTGMVAVTSAKKRWLENKQFADAIARKLAADQPFSVEQADIDSYNDWAAKRRGGAAGLAKPHPDLKPGTYRPSELPSDFAASKTPGMPKALNGDAVIAATRIYRGEMDVDQAIGGPKQRSFVNNLMDPSDKRFATVDTWHYRAAMAGIPVTKAVGPKGHQRTYTYTLEQWTNRDLTVTDGRAKLYGYDGRRDRYDPRNLKATIDAADSQAPQTFFQSGPSSVADSYRSSYGTYPWFVKQTQAAADQLGVTPNALQAVAWYAVGGGA